MADVLQHLEAIEAEVTCSLCANIYSDPVNFAGCSHIFCRDCVINTIEGPGITKSECPTCHQPGWKKDLQTNHKFKSIASAVQKLKQELGTADIASCNPSTGRS
ncbi:hypothetical protein WJX74_003980 [Apatococcus lobatus]|uniref:RING-type domain-containing protein n=1 Tax=Apatococcus lobatus TaxID=904363 RepID=A0AAW1SE61_9CHLO